MPTGIGAIACPLNGLPGACPAILTGSEIQLSVRDLGRWNKWGWEHHEAVKNLGCNSRLTVDNKKARLRVYTGGLLYE